MSVRQVKVWVVECDNCGEWIDFGGGEGWSCFKTRKDLREAQDATGLKDKIELNTCSAKCASAAVAERKQG